MYAYLLCLSGRGGGGEAYSPHHPLTSSPSPCILTIPSPLISSPSPLLPHHLTSPPHIPSPPPSPHHPLTSSLSPSCSLTAAPRHVNYADVKRDLQGIPGVKHAHSLHIWSLTLSRTALAAHLALGGCGHQHGTILGRGADLCKEPGVVIHSTADSAMLC